MPVWRKVPAVGRHAQEEQVQVTREDDPLGGRLREGGEHGGRVPGGHACKKGGSSQLGPKITSFGSCRGQGRACSTSVLSRGRRNRSCAIDCCVRPLEDALPPAPLGIQMAFVRSYYRPSTSLSVSHRAAAHFLYGCNASAPYVPILHEIVQAPAKALEHLACLPFYPQALSVLFFALLLVSLHSIQGTSSECLQPSLSPFLLLTARQSSHNHLQQSSFYPPSLTHMQGAHHG